MLMCICVDTDRLISGGLTIINSSLKINTNKFKFNATEFTLHTIPLEHSNHPLFSKIVIIL